jgi:hypothetical protein
LEPEVVLRAMLHGIQESPSKWEIGGSVVKVQNIGTEQLRLIAESMGYSDKSE